MYVHTDETYRGKYFKLLIVLWGCRESGAEREIWQTEPIYERCSALMHYLQTKDGHEIKKLNAEKSNN